MPTPAETRAAGLEAMIDALLGGYLDGADGDTPTPEAVAHAHAVADLLDDPEAADELLAGDYEE